MALCAAGCPTRLKTPPPGIVPCPDSHQSHPHPALPSLHVSPISRTGWLCRSGHCIPLRISPTPSDGGSAISTLSAPRPQNLSCKRLCAAHCCSYGSTFAGLRMASTRTAPWETVARLPPPLTGWLAGCFAAHELRYDTIRETPGVASTVPSTTKHTVNLLHPGMGADVECI